MCDITYFWLLVPGTLDDLNAASKMQMTLHFQRPFVVSNVVLDLPMAPNDWHK